MTNARPKEIKCPSCSYGYMSKLEEPELKKLEIEEGKKFINQEIWGCDECQHWSDVEFLFDD